MATDNEKIMALSEKEADKLLGKEAFRLRIKEIIDEHTGSVNFMEKVRKYAGMEIDSRLFTSGKYWLTLIFTSVLTSAIGFSIARFADK